MPLTADELLRRHAHLLTERNLWEKRLRATAKCFKQILSVGSFLGGKTSNLYKIIMYDSKAAIEAIERHSSIASPRYGKLLNWPDPVWPIWHYGIGLSDTHIFDTGAGWMAVEKVDVKFVIGVDHLHQPSQKVISRLKLAVQVFESWKYHFFGWNCEHLARLVATGEARCYAIGPILIFPNPLGDGINRDANRIFKELSDKHSETRIEHVEQRF